MWLWGHCSPSIKWSSGPTTVTARTLVDSKRRYAVSRRKSCAILSTPSPDTEVPPSRASETKGKRPQTRRCSRGRRSRRILNRPRLKSLSRGQRCRCAHHRRTVGTEGPAGGRGSVHSRLGREENPGRNGEELGPPAERQRRGREGDARHCRDVARRGAPRRDDRVPWRAYRLAGSPAGCFSHTGGCSALHAMEAMRQALPLFTSVNTSAPQWDQAPLT